MDRTACTEPQCLYKGALYLYLTVELYLYSPLWAVQPVQSLSACTRVHFTFFYLTGLPKQLFDWLTHTLLTWRIWWDPNNASKWQMGFNSAFKGIRCFPSRSCLEKKRRENASARYGIFTADKCTMSITDVTHLKCSARQGVLQQTWRIY